MSAGRARLFVAVDLPDEPLGRLDAWARQQVGADERLRLVAREDLHVTLCFLGWRDEDESPGLARLLEGCAPAAGELEPARAAWLPPRRPRVLAVDLHDHGGGLAALQRRVSEALARSAGYRPEARPFRPHVTVARVRSGARAVLPRGPDLPPPPPGRFAAQALTLYRSHLRRAGARYEPLARVPLWTRRGGA